MNILGVMLWFMVSGMSLLDMVAKSHEKHPFFHTHSVHILKVFKICSLKGRLERKLTTNLEWPNWNENFKKEP